MCLYWPVRKLAREGEQTGEVVNAFGKFWVTPERIAEWKAEGLFDNDEEYDDEEDDDDDRWDDDLEDDDG